MITELQSKALNKKLIERIDKLKNLLSRLTPEHFKYIDPLIVQTIKHIKPYFYTYDDNATINGIDAYKFSSMIRYLQAFRVELEKQTVDVTIDEDGDTTGDVVVKVPNPTFDGRNSFVFPTTSIPYSQIKATPSIDKKVPKQMNFYVEKSHSDVTIHYKHLQGKPFNLTILFWRFK